MRAWGCVRGGKGASFPSLLSFPCSKLFVPAAGRRQASSLWDSSQDPHPAPCCGDAQLLPSPAPASPAARRGKKKQQHLKSLKHGEE